MNLIDFNKHKFELLPKFRIKNIGYDFFNSISPSKLIHPKIVKQKDFWIVDLVTYYEWELDLEQSLYNRIRKYWQWYSYRS